MWLYIAFGALIGVLGLILAAMCVCAAIVLYDEERDGTWHT